jgi:hypothetical protein
VCVGARILAPLEGSSDAALRLSTLRCEADLDAFVTDTVADLLGARRVLALLDDAADLHVAGSRRPRNVRLRHGPAWASA